MSPHDERHPPEKPGQSKGTSRGTGSDYGSSSENPETTSGGVSSPGSPDLAAPTLINEPLRADAPTIARPFQPTSAQVIAGRFLVRRVLGEGGMGRVYAVQDKQIEGRDVALKVLLPRYSKNEQFKKLFFQEIKSAQKFVSEFVCQVRDTGETEDGSLFLTMDLIDGEALRALLDRDKVLGPRQSLEITRQVLLGLQGGHEKGLVHRDIKPSNVMLAARIPKTDTNPYGVGVRLLDFGIAGVAAEIGERSRAGTVMYMSPEQANGEKLDARSDLFAVGVLMFEMLSGRRPFEGATTHALVQSVIQTNINDRLDEIPNLQKPVRRILERALQKDREKRFQSAGEFAAAIVKSSSYRLPKEVPGWAYAALAVLGVAAVGEGVVLKGTMGDVDRLELESRQFEGRIRDAVSTAEQSKDTVIGEREASIRDLNARIGTLDSQLTGKSTELEQARADLSDEKAEHVKTKAELTTTKSVAEQAESNARDREKNKDDEITQLREARDFEKQRADGLQKDLADLRDENSRVGREGTDTVKLARAFDRMVALLEKGDARSALRFLEDPKNVGLFTKAGADGADVVVGLVRGAASYETFVESKNPKQLGQASRELSSAEKALETFSIQADAWLREVFQEDPNPDRDAHARRLLANTKSAVANALEATAKDDELEFSGLDLAALRSNPKPIFDHSERYDCKKHFSSCAEKLLNQLRADVVPGESLDLARLREFSALDQWVGHLNDGHFTLLADDADELRRVEFAQRWYDENPANDESGWSASVPATPKGRTTDWRQVLYLQWRLTQPASNYPIAPGGVAAFRQTDVSGGVSWRKELSLDANRLTVEVQSYDERGAQRLTPSKTSFSFDAGVLREVGSPRIVLDLHSREYALAVAPFAYPASVERVPPVVAVDQDLRKFRDLLSAESVPCLIVEETNRERWISPKLGIVYDEAKNSWKRELVHATVAP